MPGKNKFAAAAQQFTVGPVARFQPADTRKFTGGGTIVQGIETPELYYRSNKRLTSMASP
ncbi:hypothetical protein A8F94_08325 [Bacillus sp. FJAT-27225]|nr:hypothetical protein A8F94_08325 [Bacillus sp. FJAT-27225]